MVEFINIYQIYHIFSHTENNKNREINKKSIILKILISLILIIYKLILNTKNSGLKKHKICKNNKKEASKYTVIKKKS